MAEDVKCTIDQRSQSFCETHIAYGSFLAVQAYRLSSKLPTRTHQLHYLT